MQAKFLRFPAIAGVTVWGNRTLWLASVDVIAKATLERHREKRFGDYDPFDHKPHRNRDHMDA